MYNAESGESHCIIFRANGIKRHYLVGFDGVGKVSLICHDFAMRLKPFPLIGNMEKRISSYDMSNVKVRI